MEPTRSLLFVPANREKMVAKMHDLPADGFILDLEDSVPPAEKSNARAAAADHVASGRTRDRALWVRVNSLESELLAEDMRAVLGKGRVSGFIVPKVETVADVRRIAQVLDGLEAAAGVAAGSTEIIVILESAKAVLFTFDLASASPRVASLAFGGARDGDFMTDVGCDWSIDGPEIMYARQHALLAMRAARIDNPFDSVFADIRDPDGYERDTVLSVRLGYRGRKAIHPSQIEPANRLYKPSARQVDYYGRLLEAFEAAVKRGEASTTLDGKMVDVAMAANARRVLRAAEHFRGR